MLHGVTYQAPEERSFTRRVAQNRDFRRMNTQALLIALRILAEQSNDRIESRLDALTDLEVAELARVLGAVS